jgi:hypothetical protein
MLVCVEEEDGYRKININHVQQITAVKSGVCITLSDGEEILVAGNIDDEKWSIPIGVVPAPPGHLLVEWDSRGAYEDAPLATWLSPIVAYRVFAENEAAQPVTLHYNPSEYAVMFADGRITMTDDKTFENLEEFETEMYKRLTERRKYDEARAAEKALEAATTGETMT